MAALTTKQQVQDSIDDMKSVLDEIGTLVSNFTDNASAKSEADRLSAAASKLGVSGLPAEFLRQIKMNDTGGVFAS